MRSSSSCERAESTAESRVRASLAGLSPGLPWLIISRFIPRKPSILRHILEQVDEVFGVLFFLGQDRLHEPARRRILRADVLDHLAIAFDRDALGEQIGLEHLPEVGLLV